MSRLTQGQIIWALESEGTKAQKLSVHAKAEEQLLTLQIEGIRNNALDWIRYVQGLNKRMALITFSALIDRYQHHIKYVELSEQKEMFQQLLDLAESIVYTQWDIEDMEERLGG